MDRTRPADDGYDQRGSDGGATRRKFLLASGAAGAALVAGCTTTGTGGGGDVDLSVANLEVTQAIQYLDNPTEPDNSLPLVRGKRAFVRMYVDVSGTTKAVPGVDGRLRVYVNGTELAGSPFTSVNGPISAPVTPDREVTDHTLNFQFLVPETGFGFGAVSVDFEAEVNHDASVAEMDYENNTMELTDVTFECHRSPSIAYVPIDYTFEGESDPAEMGLPDSWMIRPGIGDDFIWHSFPIPEPPNYYKAATPPVEWDEDVDTTYPSLQAELETTRALLSPQPDMLYGWLPGNPFWGNGYGPGSTAAFGNTDEARYQRTFAHEIGHLFGLGHNSRILDSEVGFYSSWPVSGIRIDDCDATGDERTKCSSLYDVMAGGRLTREAWIDPETYSHLANHELISESTCPPFVFPRLPFREYYLITGVIPRRERLGGPSLNPVYRLEGPTRLTPEDRDGSRRIELRNEDDEVLFEHTFEVSFHGGDSEEPFDQAAFALTVPAENDREVASVVLLSEGEEVARIERSPNPPEIEIESPEPGETLKERVPIRWEADDEDGDRLRFSVQYSPDEGESFVPLTVNITETGFDLDTSQVPGSYEETGLIRVIATDGFNTTVEEVGGLTVSERKPPTVHITEPKGHDERGQHTDGEIEVPDGWPLILSGYGYDMEDGFLEGKALRWESNRDGHLGVGRSLQVTDLSSGEHTISLVGVDSDRNRSEDSIVVVVG